MCLKLIKHQNSAQWFAVLGSFLMVCTKGNGQRQSTMVTLFSAKHNFVDANYEKQLVLR